MAPIVFFTAPLAIATLAGAFIALRTAFLPERNRKCLISLAFFFLGWSCLLGAVSIGHDSELPIEDAGMFGAALCNIAAFLLSILGLVEAWDPAETRRRGRSSGIAGLVGSSLCLGFFALAVFEHASASASGPAPNSIAAAERYEFPDLNFHFTHPDPRFESVDPKSLNPDCSVAFLCNDPELFLLVIAEAPGIGSGHTTHDLEEAARANLRSVATDVEFGAAARREYGGIPGVRFSSFARVNQMPLVYEHWVSFHRGFAYQVIVGAPESFRHELPRLADSVFGSFRVIDPSRVAGATEAQLPNQSVAAYGYAVDFEGSGWIEWADARSAVPEAHTAARDDRLGFVVIPLLDAKSTPTGPLREAFLASLGHDEIEVRSPIRTLREGTVRAEEYAFTTSGDGGRQRYLTHLWQTENAAYLVAAWGPEALTRDEESLRDVVERFRLLPWPEDPPRWSPRLRVQQATLHNRLALIAFDRGLHEEAQRGLERALELDPENLVLFGNLIHTLSARGDHASVLEQIERHPRIVARAPEIAALGARARVKSGDIDGALDTYRELFASGYRDSVHLDDCLHTFTEQGRVDEALAIVERYRAAGDSIAVRTLHARVLESAKRFDEGIALITPDAATNIDAALALIDLYRAKKAPEDAIRVLDRTAELGFNSAEAFVLRATIEYDRGEFASAKRALEAALDRNPQSKPTRDFLAHVSSVLGEGDNSSIKTEIPAVPLPSDLPAPIGSAHVDEGTTHFVRAASSISFVPGSEHRVTEYYSIAVEDSAGVQRFSTIRHSFKPLAEEVYVNRLDVFDRDGNLVASGSVSSYYVVDESDSQLVTGGKVLNIPVPALETGHRIEFAITTRRRAPDDHLPYLEHWFSAAFPIAQSVLCINGGEGGWQWHGYRTAPPLQTEQDGRPALAWVETDPPPFVWEPNQVPFHDHMPYVALSGTPRSWSELGAEYLGEITEPLELDHDVCELSEMLIEAFEDRDTQIAALAHFVQTELTYKGIEFGRRGRIMLPAPQTLRNRYGDCKDHSLLLWQLLRCADVPAELALVNSRGRVHRELPSLDQFDHMVVYLPEDGRVIDATDKDGDFRREVPWGLAGKQILVLDPEPHLETLTDRYSGDHHIHVDRQVTVVDRSHLDVRERVTARGHHAAALRARLRKKEESEYSRALHDLLGLDTESVAGWRLKISGLDNVTAPVEIDVRYRIERGVRRVGEQWIAELPAYWEEQYLRFPSLEDRQTPFEFETPLELSTQTTVTGPDDLELTSLSSVDAEETTPFLTWSSQVAHPESDAPLRLRTEFSHPVGHYPASDYTRFVSLLGEARDAFRPLLVWSESGAK